MTYRWMFFQFHHKEGEVVHGIHNETGKQFTALVDKQVVLGLQKANRQLYVRIEGIPVEGSAKDHLSGRSSFNISVSKFGTPHRAASIRMNAFRGGVAVGHVDHYKGFWENVRYQELASFFDTRCGTSPSPKQKHTFDSCTQDMDRNAYKTRSNEMNIDEMITIMQVEAGAKLVSCIYSNVTGWTPDAPPPVPSSATNYTFKNVIGVDLAVGDRIVVEDHSGFALVEVCNPDVSPIDVGVPLGQLRHVVAKVRNDEFLAVKESEARAHRQLALSEVTSKLTTYREQVGDEAFHSVANVLGLPGGKDPVEATPNQKED